MSVFCDLPFAAALFAACAGPGPLAVGYVEGEFVRIAPVEVARVTGLSVRRGDRVAAGAALAQMETEDASLAVAQAQAAVSQARAQLADLKLGRRPQEIAVLEATLATARSQAELARQTLGRTQELFSRGAATRAQFDNDTTQVRVTESAIAQASANLDVARLPARPDAIKAAEDQVGQATAGLRQAEWRLAQRRLVAPSAGRIDDIIRNPGDLGGPSAPVLSLLPDGAVKPKLYLPEPAMARVKVGARLAVRCDGCAGGLIAQVSYVSPDPEFTPPVIYSLEMRQKLVFLIEARPEGEASRLQPGQIVDVILAQP